MPETPSIFKPFSFICIADTVKINDPPLGPEISVPEAYPRVTYLGVLICCLCTEAFIHNLFSSAMGTLQDAGHLLGGFLPLLQGKHIMKMDGDAKCKKIRHLAMTYVGTL